MGPYHARTKHRPSFESARKMLDNLELMDAYIESEKESLERIHQYRDDLPKIFEKLENDFKLQLASLYQLLNEASMEV